MSINSNKMSLIGDDAADNEQFIIVNKDIERAMAVPKQVSDVVYSISGSIKRVELMNKSQNQSKNHLS